MKKMIILAGGLMAIALSLVLFADKPLTVQEALILKNVEAIAQEEVVDVYYCFSYCNIDHRYDCYIYQSPWIVIPTYCPLFRGF